jgi:gamma-glutamyltranspeptidase / glutathione hydrolase
MRPKFVRRSFFAALFQAFRPYFRLTFLAFAVSVAGCGSLMGDDEADTSRPLGVVVGPDRDSRGLTGRGQATAEDALSAARGGFVLGDEPTAVLAARDVLEQGGTAADAATALYFTLAVTQPTSAGLGGGGICLVHDASKRTTESVEFLPRHASAGGAIAVPGNVRGFALLHARYGRQSWKSLLAAPERMAAIGTPVSRAMARSLSRNVDTLRAEPELAGLLSRTGAPLKELDLAEQVDLAATLGFIRSRGVAALYGGDGAVTFAAAIAEAGGAVSVDDLRNYRPSVSDALMVQSGGIEVYLPSSNTGAGAFASAMWNALQNVSPSDNAGAIGAANATAQSLGAPGRLPDDMGSTGFVAVSARGDAVACAVTMNGPLGIGRTAPGMGVILAAAPDGTAQGLAPAFLSPVVGTTKGNSNLVFAAASGGGPAAVAGVQQVLRQSVGASGQSVAVSVQGATQGTSVLINALVCPLGLPRGIDRCEIAVDPKGAGLGAEAIGQ